MITSGQKYPKAVSVVLLVLCCSVLLASASPSARKKRVVRPIALQLFEDLYDDTPRSEAGSGRNLFRNWYRLRNFFRRKKNKFFTRTPTTTSLATNIPTPISVLSPSARGNAEELVSEIDDKLAGYEDENDLYDRFQRPVNRHRVGIQASTNIYRNRQKLRKTSNNRINQQINRNANKNHNRPVKPQHAVFNTYRAQPTVIYKI